MEPATDYAETVERPPREAPRELIERAWNDADAVADLYRIYYDRLFNLAMRRLLDVAEAEDATGATFLKMVANLPIYRWTGRPFSAWLYRILINEITDRLRRCRSVRIVSLDAVDSERSSLLAYVADTGLSPSERLDALERFAALHKAISTLSIKQQNVVTLRYFERLPLKEIAHITGSTIGMVKWRLHTSLRKLAGRLKDFA